MNKHYNYVNNTQLQGAGSFSETAGSLLLCNRGIIAG